MRDGQPDPEQVLLLLWKFVALSDMFILQSGQPALRQVLRIMWTKAGDETLELRTPEHTV